MYQSAKGCLIYVCNKEESSNAKEEVVHPLLQSLCEGYADIFKETTGLPPQRSHESPDSFAARSGASQFKTL